MTHDYADNSRGLGLADLATAIRTGNTARASGNLAFHVLETMHAIYQASDTGKHVDLTHQVERPAPLTALG